MDPSSDFKFGPQPPLAPFTKDPQAAPTPSAGIWAPQPHPAPINQALNPLPPQPAAPITPGAPQSAQPPPVQAAAPAPPSIQVPAPPASQGQPPAVPRQGSQATSSVPLAAVVMSGARPVPAIQPTAAPAVVATAVQSAPDLGLLAPLLGKWQGKGFNVIWRPNNSTGSDHFLELNLTDETLEYKPIDGDIPNRGLRQGDISMRGMYYLQQIADSVSKQGLHLETGIWAIVPPTVNPLEPETFVRMASIPHGTSMLAQGTALTSAGAPLIPPVSIAPFLTAVPTNGMTFSETNLSVPAAFRSPPAQIVDVTQQMVDNPNSLLTATLAGQTIRRTTQVNVSTQPTPVIGGGVANTAFLLGGSSGPNAQATQATASFWLEMVAGAGGAPDFLQLQYSQTVMLNFAGVSWPHVSVGTLKRV